MAEDDLIRLIDLSLGVEPQGVVNFNYLHGLLHEIVRRLVDIESVPMSTSRPLSSKGSSRYKKSGSVSIDATLYELGEEGEVDEEGERGVDEKEQAKKVDEKRRSLTGAKKRDGSIDATKKGDDAKKGDDTKKGDDAKQGDDSKEGDDSIDDSIDAKKGDSSADRKSSLKKGGDFIDTKKEEDVSADEESRIASPSTRPESMSTKQESFISVATSGSKQFMKRYDSRSRSRTSIVTASNDIGALERKMHDLEQRVNTMESIPAMFEKKFTDPGSSPVSDMWNFTLLNNRLNAAENGLDKTSKLLDELLGQFHDLQSQVDKIDESGSQLSRHLSGELSATQAKLKELEDLKPAAESIDDALITDLQAKMKDLQADIDKIKAKLEGHDFSTYVSADDLDKAIANALTEQAAMLHDHETSLKSQSQSLAEIETSLVQTQEVATQMEKQVDQVDDELKALKDRIGELEANLEGKVNASDMASMMPSSGEESDVSNLLSKLIELQTKINQLESQIGAFPSDIQEQMSNMKSSIQDLADQLASLLSRVDSKPSTEGDISGQLEALSSQVAQLRERINELDRAMSAVSDFVSTPQPREASEADEELDGGKYVDSDSFDALQQLVGQLQEENERLIGTAAHLSHELDISKEHIKSLYSGVDNLKDTKADRTQLEVEVREKADRRALDTKASRDWVDNTFDKLDKEIREAKSRMLGQEESLKNAVSQLTVDVEGKLDRLELQPLKDYFDKRIDRVKTAPPSDTLGGARGDDAAGIRKGLHFHCISCAKPVEMKQRPSVATLPSITSLPGTRTFRPYTTYELEYIRRHQRIGFPLPPPQPVEYFRNARSAGGSHTMTRPYQRMRTAPFNSIPTTPDTYTQPMTSRSRSTGTTAYSPRSRPHTPMVNDEMDIVGNDGHIYKGRHSQNRLLPPVPKYKRKGTSHSHQTY